MIFGQRLSERSKLGASIVLNGVTRLPGVISLLVVLPKFQRELGDGYAAFLSAMALAALAAFSASGVNTAIRRLLAFAYGADDRAREADVAASALTASLLSLASSSLIALIASLALGYSAPVTCAVLIAVVAIHVNFIDNVRAAYNEHFVTAALQSVTLTVFLVLTLASDFRVLGVIGAAALSMGGLAMASLINGALLIARRPHLLKGKATHTVEMARSGFLVGISDAAMLGMLNVTLIWSGQALGPSVAAWYGSLLRSFQTLLAPMMLVLVPLSTFLSIRWGRLEDRRRRLYGVCIVVGCLGAVGMTFLAIAVGGRFYVEQIVKVAPLDNVGMLLAASAAMAAVVGHRIYALIVYAVSDAKRLAVLSLAAALVAVAILLGLDLVAGPQLSLQVQGAVFVVLVVAIIVHDGLRRFGPRKAPVADAPQSPG